MTLPSGPENPKRGGVFRNRRFVELWAGSTISLVGDQCCFIALPWVGPGRQ